MTDLYLITGFLGAGKTTFLKGFARLFQREKIYVIVNEFGKAGVDGALLRELGASLSEVNNGSIFCACRLDKFEEVLTIALASQPDVILVEASGLADPTNVRKVLKQPQFDKICYKGFVCLVDTVRFEKIIDTSRVCKKQLAVSSVVLLNKTDLATPDKISFAKEKISALNPTIVFHETTYGAFKDEWLDDIVPQTAVDEATHGADITLQKALVHISKDMNLSQLHSFLAMMSDDTYRMKGFVALGESEYLVDCVSGMIDITPFSDAPRDDIGKIVLLAGAGMPLRKSLKTAAEWYGDYVEVEKNT